MAPLLIGRGEVKDLARYLYEDLGLRPKQKVRVVRKPPPLPPPRRVRSRYPKGKRHRHQAKNLIPVQGATVVNESKAASAHAADPEISEEAADAAFAALAVNPNYDAEAEKLGPMLLEARCSKCHTLRRVYTKILSQGIGLGIIERMRRKTGAGIPPPDADVLRRFIRSRFAQ